MACFWIKGRDYKYVVVYDKTNGKAHAVVEGEWINDLDSGFNFQPEFIAGNSMIYVVYYHELKGLTNTKGGVQSRKLLKTWMRFPILL